MEIGKREDYTDNSSCTLEFDEANQWIRAIWRGYIDNSEATVGAMNYLLALKTFNSPYLLNDNSAIEGPWFDSIDWLEKTWLPRAAAQGLRYVAHVIPPGGHDILYSAAMRRQEITGFELQVFDCLSDAEQWLHSCKKKDALN